MIMKQMTEYEIINRCKNCGLIIESLGGIWFHNPANYVENQLCNTYEVLTGITADNLSAEPIETSKEIVIKREEIKERLFNYLIDEMKRLYGVYDKTIQLDENFILKFRYAEVKINNDLIKFPVISPKTENNNIYSLVCDVWGLYNIYVTEVIFKRENNKAYIYISESQTERWNHISEFINIIDMRRVMGYL